MKKFFLMAVLFLLTLTAYSQHYVTKFLGIPVDGSKSEMIRKLKAKGFQSTKVEDVLTGEFNGTNVYIGIHTNNNKVWRIVVYNAISLDEQEIKNHFNRLCDQFSKNSRYVAVMNSTIPEKENILYEINVNKKEYQAAFIQWPTTEDVKSLSEEDINRLKLEAENRVVWFTILKDGIDYSIALFYENRYNQANGEDL